MSPRPNLPAPPFDPELAPVLDQIADFMPSTIRPEHIPALREAPAVPLDDLIAGRPITQTEHVVPGRGGSPDVILAVFARSDHEPGGLGLYHIHGGGMVVGDRFTGIGTVLDWVDTLDAVAVSVEYRLAPEHPDPVPLEDCYAGLVWTAAHAVDLGFEPNRLVVVGASAGGGLAAGVTLMARDKGAPAIAGQILTYPMLDDRNETTSSRQIDGIGVWDHTSNETGWNAYLGQRRARGDVSIYAAPARATDLSNLPPTFIDLGSADVFRDEDVAYASKIWADGGVAELHVWPGGFHLYDAFAPQATLSLAMAETRTAWLKRLTGQ
jgi:acetyl esterase/lipase